MVSDMKHETSQTSPITMALLVALNVVPLIGVVSWGWKTFDLIFLYWMENVVIGLFSLARMVVRPYRHPLELVLPLFMAPFFAFHYGGFCWGHGTFVMGLFGPDDLDAFDLVPAALQVLSSGTMLAALAALALIQVMDWVRDATRRGLGADGVKELMVAPYRRIMVLHVTLLAAGFALEAMKEPVIGLVILVLVKTLSDVWHWKKDNEMADAEGAFTFTPEHLKEMQEKYPRPVVTVNGQEKEFESFAAMRDSSEFRMAETLMRLIGAGEELKAIRTYLEMKIEEESSGNGWAGVEGRVA
jgi:hypothetical protein